MISNAEFGIKDLNNYNLAHAKKDCLNKRSSQNLNNKMKKNEILLLRNKFHEI